MSKLANMAHGFAVWWGNIRGSKPAHIITENNRIKTKFVNPNKDKIAWDDLYSNAAIFFQGYANPVKILYDEDKEESELIYSSRYKTFMSNNIIEKAFSTEGGIDKTLFYVTFGLLGLSILLNLVVIGMVR